ncbi:MAG TPA: flagellar biosynthetic protein FliO [Bryobacteraceae bacterium]|jgi:flagellar biogenesis protein FliO
MDVVQPVAAIFLVLALLSGALLTLKKRGVVSRNIVAGHRLEVVERIALGPHHALHVVRAGDRFLLVATAPNSCQLLDHTVSGEEKA